MSEIVHARFSRFGFILLAPLTLGWGLNWPIMKIVLSEVPPLTFRAVCLLAGGSGVLLVARLAGQSWCVPRRYWKHLLALTACNIIGWNVFVVYGVSLLPSGRAALLGYTMPLWSMSLSVWLLDERVTLSRATALVLATVGVLVLMSADLTKLGDALSGVACMLAAAFFWGLGVVLLKRFALPLPTVSLTGWMLVCGGVPIALAALAVEPSAWRPIGFYPALGMLYNVVVAFMFCYWAWNRIVLMVPVAVASLASLVTPVVGVLSGALLLHERLSWHEVAAAALILGAIWLVLREPSAASARGPNDAPII
jgi:drug/metabolite transporter (DMT)-like permease